MYSETGLTLGDLKKKLDEISKYISDDTDISLYVSYQGFDTNYTVNRIGVAGLNIKTDDDDRDSPPAGLEFISEDCLEQSDVYTGLVDLGYDATALIIDFLCSHGDVDAILDYFGGGR